MAPPPGTMRVSRYFTALGVILGLLYLIVLLPGNANTPKLGIDLVGGIRVIFTAVPPAGKTVTSTSMEQARQIIEDRINGNGVTASTVQIQGDDQLVVSIPGGTDTDVQRLGQAAQLNFRPAIAPAIPNSCISSSGKGSGSASPSGSTSPSVANSPGSAPGASAGPSGTANSGSRSSSASPSGSDAPNALNQRPLTAPTSGSATASPTGTATRGAATPTGAASGTAAPSTPASQAPQPCVFDAVGKLASSAKITIPTTEAGFAKLSQAQQQQIAAALATTDCNLTSRITDRPTSYYVACGDLGGQRYAYLLGTVIIRGTQVTEANAIAPSTGQGGNTRWTVSLTLNDSGQKAWGDWTTKHNTGNQDNASVTQCGTAAGGLPCNDFVAFTLDGNVVSAPATNEPIVGQATQVSGDFDQTSATALANQLKYGALPLSFNTDSNERVSASLGTSQLKAALLAGGIGLVLVVIYSLLYYRGLGLVTIASLIVSGLLTYAMLVILGQQIGFTLDLAGIAGLIVALGITADSFVVFFERIKDEVHEGRSVRVAVPRGWVRARRTVISADVVSFLAAVILYIFASADVKGFAFTLGLSTILDLFVVVVFTHPMVALLSRSRAFGSPRFTGLNSVRAGGITPDRDEPKAKGAAARAAQRRSSTVVLDKPDDDAPDAVEPIEADTDISEPTDEAPRRRTTPQGGTAAERAAARRARQREKRDEKGEQ